MLKIISNIDVIDINESINFYKNIGFGINKDKIDGMGRRHVQMNLMGCKNSTIRFLLVRQNNFFEKFNSMNPMLSIIVENAYIYE